MYKNIKLEKGLYNLSGKSFVQALEELDPSENYSESPLANLDAYERQLKRFDIKVNGKHCDKISKFFTSTESAVLFPEFVSRAVKQGMKDSILEKITAVKTISGSRLYRGFTVSDGSAEYTTVTTEKNAFPETCITEDPQTITLDKLGRLISTSYEATMNQSIESYALTLRTVGRKLANAIVSKAITTLTTGTSSIDTATSSLAYSDITALYGLFTDFNMNVIITSPSVAASILTMPAMQDCTYDKNGIIHFPFGPALISSSQIANNRIIGLDTEYALEFISSSDVILETDKLIDKQLDRIAVSIHAGFKKIMEGAVKVLKLSA